MAIEYPYSEQAEYATLGCILVNEKAQVAALTTLTPDYFYMPNNRLVFEAMKRLYDRHQAIDITTITSDLDSIGRLQEIGGVQFLMDLAEGVVTVNIDYYISALTEKKNYRDLLDLISSVASDIQTKSMKAEDSAEYLDEVEKKVVKIVRNRQTGGMILASDLVDKYREEYKLVDSKDRKIIGVPSGYADIDRITNGWKKGDMIILGGRTSTGKTQLAINFALNAARETKNPIGFFSVEMPCEQIISRMVATLSRLDQTKIVTHKITTNDDLVKFESALDKLKEYEIYFDQTSTRLIDIQTKARKLKQEHPDLELIIIDYLQLIQGERINKNDGRAQEVRELSRGVKALARELNVPIICLSQLKRELEKSSNHEPMLSDLRESGAIEEDADLVVFVHRADRYDLGSEEQNKADAVPAKIIIAKNRNGATGNTTLVFTKSTGEFNSSFGVTQ